MATHCGATGEILDEIESVRKNASKMQAIAGLSHLPSQPRDLPVFSAPEPVQPSFAARGELHHIVQANSTIFLENSDVNKNTPRERGA